MSTNSYELFNVWFPALVCGLIIGLLAAALWDVLRRKTWLFASRFWPGVLEEVGLDDSSPSRREVKGDLREVTEKLSALASQISFLVPVKSPMAESTDSAAAESSNSNSPVSSNCDVTYHSDIEAQPVIKPLSTPSGKPITFTATAYFPDNTPVVVIRPVKKFFIKHSKGTVKRWKSSIVLQASLPIEACVLAEIGELAKSCMQVENRCTFQLGHWAILYYSAGEVHLHILKEGDVPVNVEARWQAQKTGITMRGLYLNGAQVKVATKRSSTILRSAGPATQGPGDLDELHFAIAERDVPGEDSLINAAKVVEADGISLIVRSEAGFILPSRETFSLGDAIWRQLQRISLSTEKMIKIFLKDDDRQPEATDNWPQLILRSNHEHLELIVEHWKGVSEIELLDYRKEVLQYLQEPQASGIVEGAGSQRPYPQMNYMRDGGYMEYWQRGLQELNEVLLLSIGGPQSGTHISIRGGIKFLLGDFENALYDFDLAYNMGGQRSTVLLDRAFVKCMLARYSEAKEDVVAVISINPNVNDIQELQTCIEEILHLQGSFRIVESGPLCPRPELCDLDNFRVKIPDLLTGGEWHSGQSEVFRTVSDDSTAAGSTFDLPSMRANVNGAAQGEVVLGLGGKGVANPDGGSCRGEPGVQQAAQQRKEIVQIVDFLPPVVEYREVIPVCRAAALAEWDLMNRVVRKEGRSADLSNQIYNLVGVFSVFQGVVLTAVSQLKSSTGPHCGMTWFPIVLSSVAAVVTIIGVWSKFATLKKLQTSIHNDKIAQTAVAAVRSAKLRKLGRDFSFRELEAEGRLRKSISLIEKSRTVVIGSLFTFTVLLILTFRVILCDRGL